MNNDTKNNKNKDINKSSNQQLIKIAKILFKFNDEKLQLLENNNNRNKNINRNTYFKDDDEDEKEATVILKVIYLLIIDKEKIHRVLKKLETDKSPQT